MSTTAASAVAPASIICQEYRTACGDDRTSAEECGLGAGASPAAGVTVVDSQGSESGALSGLPHMAVSAHTSRPSRDLSTEERSRVAETRNMWLAREAAKPFDPMLFIERTGVTYVPHTYNQQAFEKLQRLFMEEYEKLQAALATAQAAQAPIQYPEPTVPDTLVPEANPEPAQQVDAEVVRQQQETVDALSDLVSKLEGDNRSLVSALADAQSTSAQAQAKLAAAEAQLAKGKRGLVMTSPGAISVALSSPTADSARSLQVVQLVSMVEALTAENAELKKKLENSAATVRSLQQLLKASQLGGTSAGAVEGSAGVGPGVGSDSGIGTGEGTPKPVRSVSTTPRSARPPAPPQVHGSRIPVSAARASATRSARRASDAPPSRKALYTNPLPAAPLLPSSPADPSKYWEFVASPAARARSFEKCAVEPAAGIASPTAGGADAGVGTSSHSASSTSGRVFASPVGRSQSAMRSRAGSSSGSGGHRNDVTTTIAAAAMAYGIVLEGAQGTTPDRRMTGHGQRPPWKYFATSANPN